MGRVLNIYSSRTTFYKANPNFATITCLQGAIAQPHPAPSPSGGAICRPPPEWQRLGTPALRFSMGIHNRRQQALNTPRRGGSNWVSMKSSRTEWSSASSSPSSFIFRKSPGCMTLSQLQGQEEKGNWTPGIWFGTTHYSGPSPQMRSFNPSGTICISTGGNTLLIAKVWVSLGWRWFQECA